VIQYADAGNCFSNNNNASGNNGIVQVAATTQCPRQLIRRQVANSQYITYMHTVSNFHKA